MDAIKELKELIPILYFLLPGFLTVIIIEFLVVTKAKDVFDRIVEAFVFTFVNLVVFKAARYLIVWTLSEVHLVVPCIPEIAGDDTNIFTALNLTLMFVCSLGIGLCCAYEIVNEGLLARLRKKNLSRKTTKASTWIETFSHSQKYVVVHLEDGRRIYGWPKFYSDNPTERAIFLEDASWLDDDNRLINDDQRVSVFLDKTSGIKVIEFLEPPDGSNATNT